MNKPLISIIIPTYNRETFIIETIKSVINQNVQNWECFIIDDGSTDNTEELVNNLIKDYNNIKFIKREKQSKGASVCRNIGAQNANGDYLVFLDSDDLIKYNFIYERTLILKTHSTKDFIVFPSAFFYEDIGDCNKIWNLLNKKIDDLSRFFDQDNPWSITGPLWKKQSFMQIGGFNEHSQSAQDWEIHTKAIIYGLKYIKTEDTKDNLHHYIRKNEIGSISNEKISKKRIQNRIQTFRTIAKLFFKYNLHKSNLKTKIIGHFTEIQLLHFLTHSMI